MTETKAKANDEAVPQVSDAERIAKCRERYKRIKDLRSEMERHAEAAKYCKSQIDAALAEIEETVTKVDNQIPIPITR